MAARVTILCVGSPFRRAGAIGALVGQTTLAALGTAGCPALSGGPLGPPAVALTQPELDIPRLDGGTAAVATNASIHFGRPAPAVGATWTVSLVASSRSSDPSGGGGGDQLSTYHSDYRVEVLGVDGPAPSRVKLRFIRNVQTFQGAETPTQIDGKEYVVDARAPHVRDATDGAAPEAETQRVLDIFPDLGTRTRIDEVLPDAAMSIGDRRDELAAAILRVIHPRAWTLGAGTATLARTDGEHAVFSISLDASSDSGSRMELSGDARVRLHDAQLSDLSLDGRYERMNAKDAGIEPPGTFTLRRRITSDQEPRSDR